MSEHIDDQRSRHGFLTASELINEVGQDNVLFDESSILISKAISIGRDNIFYPGIVIEQRMEGSITIGDSNIFYPGTYIYGFAGIVRIGSENEFGPSGVTIMANMPNALIEIGSQGRYCDGASIMGETCLGSGSQVLGNIAVQSCRLVGGGTYKEADPDKRAAVLKGFGLARGIALEIGEVVNGAGDFSKATVEQQSFYHPKANSE